MPPVTHSSPRLAIRLDRAGIVEAGIGTPAVLAALLSRTGAPAGNLYVYDRECHELRLVASGTQAVPARIERILLTFDRATEQWLLHLNNPDQGDPQADPRFQNLPEALDRRFRRLMVAPVYSYGELAGVLTLAREDASAFPAAAGTHIERLAGPLAAAVTGSFIPGRLTA